jgi:hypothetical protein
MIKVPENPYRKDLADMYVEHVMGKPGDDDIKRAVNGDNEDLSLDYYIASEKMINNAIMVFRSIDEKHLSGAGRAFSKMLFYISYEIELRKAFQDKT